jgi:hypothetical protein
MALSNKALQRRPCSAFLMHTFNAVHGPAERGRWAPSPPSLISDAVRAANLVRCAIRPCGYRQMPRQAPPRRSAGNRQYPAWHRLGASPGSRAHARRATPGLPRRPSRRRSVAARWRGREPGLGKGEASAGRKWSKAKGGGVEGKPEEESQVGAVVNREGHERVAMVMVAVVAQQSVAPEPPKRGSHSYWQCRSRPR